MYFEQIIYIHTPPKTIMEAKREVGNMLVLLKVCGLVCTYVNIFMRTYDTTFHCASCSISQTSKDLKTIDIKFMWTMSTIPAFRNSFSPTFMAPLFLYIFFEKKSPDLRRGGTCRVTTTEACTLDGLPRDVSTLIYPGSKPQIQCGAVFCLWFVCFVCRGGL